MKTKKITLFSLMLMLIIPIAHLKAQINMDNNLDAKFLNKIKDRTLIVEVKEEDPKLVAKLSKKEKNADRLQEYRDFISNNNDMLKKAVDKFWKFNANIEYKTTSELKDIRGSKKDVFYEIISCTTLLSENSNIDGLSIPVICYDNSGITSEYEHDYEMYLPVSSIPDKETNPYMWTYSQADYDFAIIEMQANFAYTIANNKKIIFEDYGKKMGKENCSKMKNNTLVINRTQLAEKVQESDIKSNYKGPIELTDAKAYNDAVDNQEKGKEVIFSFCYGIAKGGFGGGVVFFSKAVMDCSTGDILYYYKPPMMGVVWMMWDIRKQIFDYMEKCN